MPVRVGRSNLCFNYEWENEWTILYIEHKILNKNAGKEKKKEFWIFEKN